MPPYTGLAAAFVCVGPLPVWRTHPSSRHQLRADHSDGGRAPPPIGESDAGLLGLSLDELGLALGGSGRAVGVWGCLSSGLDPNIMEDGEDPSDASVAAAWDAVQPTSAPLVAVEEQEKRHNGRMGRAAFQRLQELMKRYRKANDEGGKEVIRTIENSIATLSQLKTSNDGTTKLLLRMRKDGLEVESVIIPWFDKGFSTLCVSSQVGVSSDSPLDFSSRRESHLKPRQCKQGCTFCATGRMGKMRSLTTDEILVQRQLCGLPKRKWANVYYLRGMGEPADNVEQVVPAVQTLADRQMFGLAQSKITVSTVAPDPSAFVELGKAPSTLAWSVHAVDDELRRTLVPTTRHTMEELKTGLIEALKGRSNKLRRTMLEVALIDGINDSDKEAQLLARFARSIMDEVKGSKVVVNVIPVWMISLCPQLRGLPQKSKPHFAFVASRPKYNPIDHPYYRAPSKERVLRFQQQITDNGVLCYVRTTRGDEEDAACGQLATKKQKKKNLSVPHS
ncbi:hypothetical protein THAOC_34352 [Thalassiosira oceanica]|uniref:Radical SAM core domain-containing protein n=1 Tax=Thalassiosira oceanica TaxID=159749 RepID=K0RCY9_THAOC|nr:hypothetical protein THAOC_34352 [Thalassiosira oceanica]|eukprot:EJK46961.1 hypothetical protein THAOC_34352 [Thalassiosira oceanica]